MSNRRWFGDMTIGARHAAAFLFVFTLLLAGANLLFTSREIGAVERTILSQCDADRSIGNLAHTAVTVDPVTHKASVQVIGIIAAHRETWTRLGCGADLTRHLEAPSPSFTRWARYYHLPGI